jgi:hypothetical protein
MALAFFARMQNQAVTTLVRFLMRRFYIKNLPIVAEKRNKNNRQTGYLFLRHDFDNCLERFIEIHATPTTFGLSKIKSKIQRWILHS